MFIRKVLSFIFATVLALGLFAYNPTTSTVQAQSDDFDCVYTVTGNGLPTNLGYYGAKEVVHYTEEEAIAAGIPAGFSGDVLEIIGETNATNKGIVLDFSHLNIPDWAIASITFRVYVSNDTNTTDGYPEIRIPKPYYPAEWTLRYYDIKQHIAEWHDVVFTGDFSSICTDGYLDKFEIGLRHQNVSDFYIDSIKLNLVNDTTAPVITFNGEDNVTIAEGQTLTFDVSAIDAVQGEVEVEYIWSDPSKLDNEGNPLVGEHTLTFKATDYFGNTAEYTINVTVVEPDLVAPELSIPTDEIFVKIGTTPLINVVAFDDVNGEVEVVQTWSENALDQYGKLTEGTHVLTLTATDASNNQTVKTITFYVTATGDTFDVVVDEEDLCKEQESEEESESESESESELESESEEESESASEPENQSESESEKQSTSDKESSSQIESSQTSENQESATEESEEKSSSTSVVSCASAISSLPFISLFVLASIVTLTKKKKQ